MENPVMSTGHNLLAMSVYKLRASHGKQRVDVNIGPGKEQQMKDDILSKRQGNEDRDLDNRNHRIDVMIVHGKKQKMNDGILSKKRRNEDRDLDNWKHIIDANIIPGKEQKIQNDSKFMDVEVKIKAIFPYMIRI
ncbi:hypothetical protein KY285_011540 [Solanum tuberosum]|nr:hypothetical protein KY285_011540 [Solanum tuberosum]